jgi:hypothetical protein
MTTATPKLLVAAELLDRALRLYYEGGSDFAALHLAGAAEELLGKHIEAKGGESSFTSLRNAAVRLSKYFDEDRTESTPKSIANAMNHAKNATKHMDLKDDDVVVFDARTEAHDLLDRAVSNYYQAMTEYELEETVLVRRFNHGLTAGA